MTGDQAREPRDNLLQHLRLCVQLLGRRGVLLGLRGCALHDLIHLADGRADLLDAARLLGGCGPDFIGRGLHRTGDLVAGIHLLVHGVHLLPAVARLREGLLDQHGRIPGGVRGTMGQIANLIGDDCKAHSDLAGAGRFHGGVERENIRLERNLVDHFDDFGHFFARCTVCGERRVEFLMGATECPHNETASHRRPRGRRFRTR